MTGRVSATNVSKFYSLNSGPKSFLKNLILGRSLRHSIPALTGVTFSVEPGGAFGIVGNNGAGKSTLLKLLSGTTFPTSGEITLEGRSSALLELGAGLHPEFTGRQNIHFCSAVMGYAREEVEEKIDSIVAFSELGRFIEEPVRTYSSGMYVRLGFALATAFAPDILIIDEALAVGDQGFQKKCTDRILAFREAGCTLVFCSHNLYQVKNLCEEGIWLDRGQVQAQGPIMDVVSAYSESIATSPDSSNLSPADAASAAIERNVERICWIEEAILLNEKREIQNEFNSGETLILRVRATFQSSFSGFPAIGFAVVQHPLGTVCGSSNAFYDIPLRSLGSCLYEGEVVFPSTPLCPGRYYFNLVTTDGAGLQAYDIRERMVSFSVRGSGRELGVVRIPHYWK